MNNCSIHQTLITLLFLTLLIFPIRGSCARESTVAIGFQPVDTIEYRIMAKNTDGRRKLAPFQLCLLCRCCPAGSIPSECVTMPCCFGIDCALPNKPFGVCAFVPKTCNCTTCVM